MWYKCPEDLTKCCNYSVYCCTQSGVLCYMYMVPFDDVAKMLMYMFALLCTFESVPCPCLLGHDMESNMYTRPLAIRMYVPVVCPSPQNQSNG